MTQVSLGQSQGTSSRVANCHHENVSPGGKGKRNEAAQTTGSRGEDACFSSEFRKKVDFVTGGFR